MENNGGRPAWGLEKYGSMRLYENLIFRITVRIELKIREESWSLLDVRGTAIKGNFPALVRRREVADKGKREEKVKRTETPQTHVDSIVREPKLVYRGVFMTILI